jgi:hypothetical protein
MASSLSSRGQFNFLYMPREIRNKIYRNLLCSFAPAPVTVPDPELPRAYHDNSTSILLASRQIHKEAYDTMVKTNRFVRVTSAGGFPLLALLNHLRVPVVTEDHESSQFKGYVLSVSLTCPKHIAAEYEDSHLVTDPCSLMLLGRDMDRFCDVLMDGDVYVPGFGMHIAIKIAVAPGSILEPSPYKEPISDFFSETTQQALLKPFCDRLRGFKKVKVRGLVSKDIAEAAEQAMAQNTASDPEAVLAKYQKEKDEGQVLYKAKKLEDAWLKWQDAALEIEQLRVNSSWDQLTEKGGIPFVSRLAEIYFMMKLNVLHISISNIQTHQPFADVLASDVSKMAMKALTTGYWMKGFKWSPSTMHKAKFWYRYATIIRLTNDTHWAEQAVRGIGVAHTLLPDDAAIARERDAVVAWKASLR